MSSPFDEHREVWDAYIVEDLYLPDRRIHIDEALASITWSPATFHLTLWIAPLSGECAGEPMTYSTGLPAFVVARWAEYGLPVLSHECLLKLSALEAARGGAKT